MKVKSRQLFGTLALLIACQGMLSQAATVQFTIDPAQTQVTLSGVAAGMTVTEQSPGSLTTAFGGHVNAEVSDSSIHFVGGSLIDALPNGDLSPKADGVVGTEQADFGAAVSGSILGFAATGTGALREVVLDLQSQAPVPLNQGQFEANGLWFVFPEGSPSAFDYRVTAFIITEAGRELLAGNATNSIATVGSLATEGDTQTLTIPVDATYTFELLNPDDSTLVIKGQLVATRPLDAPADLVIASARFENGQLIFEWNGDPNQPHQIQSTSDLVNWNTVAEIPPGVSSWEVPVTSGTAFFRVGKSP